MEGDAAQSPEDLCDVRAEDALIAMGLVDDDVTQTAEEASPTSVCWKHRVVEHVWIREDEIRMFPCELPLLLH